MKYKYSIYALDYEWLQCSGIGQRSPAYCMALVAIIISITIKNDSAARLEMKLIRLDMNYILY